MPRFRILHGVHHAAGGVRKDTPTLDHPDRVYRAKTALDPHAPDVIETDEDLEALYNPPGAPKKYERVRDDSDVAPAALPPSAHVWDPAKETLDQFVRRVGGAPAPADSLDALSVKELHALADDEEIDLKGARTKEELVAAIRRARG
jgi:hypothetical protein